MSRVRDLASILTSSSSMATDTEVSSSIEDLKISEIMEAN
jgi:hypothetical protein